MDFSLNAETRTEQGKGASRRLRRTGKVPAIVYGAHQDPRALTLDHNELTRKLAHEAFYSHILTLNIGGESERVVLKDMQRHPYKPIVMHVDLQRVAENEKLTMRVPLHFLNEGSCPAVKTGGGVVSHLMSDIEIICLPRDLPEYIEVDLMDMNLGDTLHVSDLKLPPGVEAADVAHHEEADQPVVSIHLPRVASEAAEGEAAGEESGAGSE